MIRPVITYLETAWISSWRNIDPTTNDQQFADHGNAVPHGDFLWQTQRKKRQAEASRDALLKSGKFQKNRDGNHGWPQRSTIAEELPPAVLQEESSAL